MEMALRQIRREDGSRAVLTAPAGVVVATKQHVDDVLCCLKMTILMAQIHTHFHYLSIGGYCQESGASIFVARDAEPDGWHCNQENQSSSE